MRRFDFLVPEFDAIMVSADVVVEPIVLPELDPVVPLAIGALEARGVPMVDDDPVVDGDRDGCAVPLPVGVPVSPIGVPWVLCWPAPTGALLTAGFGGFPWAKAVPISATVATPASRALNCFDAVMEES